MSQKYATTLTLVIVESPAKCKKIEDYLGPGYKCIATYGHIRQLTSLENIDIANGSFCPTFFLQEDPIKKKQFDKLKKAIREADDVILATDNDREGEAISWHICDAFHLPIDKTKRILFHEITESAILKAVQNPTRINMDLVYAQQTRQIVDILFGFKITPVLWKYISQKGGLSAGRCQSPALRLIYDNQKEIDSLESSIVYQPTGTFTNMNLPFVLNRTFTNGIDKSLGLEDFLQGSLDFSHVYHCQQPTKGIYKSPQPFTTSRLQQKASNELHFSPKETMKVCQTLYEAGYITYMRTDSSAYSCEFIQKAKEYIEKEYDSSYFMEKFESVLSKEKEAHEAIRCTNISLKTLTEKFSAREKKMYTLIWENTLESCMADATFFRVKATISAFSDCEFSYTSEKIDFPGWKKVKEAFSQNNKEYHYLQTIKEGIIIPFTKISCKAGFHNVGSHYTEARLVQLLEEKGIGRPSTFAMLTDKIQERGYVKKEDIPGKEILVKEYEIVGKKMVVKEVKREMGKEKGKLVIQPLGKKVSEFLETHFSEILNYEYTREMEEQLDKIAKNDGKWQSLCRVSNTILEDLLEKVKKEKKYCIPIDETHSIVFGKYGHVVKCEEIVDNKKTMTFLSIKKGIDLDRVERKEISLEEIVENTPIKSPSQSILGTFEGKEVKIKKGKFGLYVEWGENRKTLKSLGNRPVESITLNEIMPLLEEGSSILREISKNITLRKGEKGNYLFYKTAKMKKPQFFVIEPFLETETLSKVKEWIKKMYDIE